MIDVSVWGFVMGVASFFFAPTSPVLESELTLTLLVLLTWVFIEAMLLSGPGTTLGKLVLNISIVKKDGGELRFPEMLKRSFQVWFFGLGVGIPIISLLTLANQYGKLKKEGVTSWDRNGGIVVRYGTVGGLRILAICVLLVSIIWLVALGYAE